MSTAICQGKNCFFCMEPIEGEGVEWDEQNNWTKNPDGEGLTKIHLHGKCSVDLGIRLIGDGFEISDDKTPETIKMLVDSRVKILPVRGSLGGGR